MITELKRGMMSNHSLQTVEQTVSFQTVEQTVGLQTHIQRSFYEL